MSCEYHVGTGLADTLEDDPEFKAAQDIYKKVLHDTCGSWDEVVDSIQKIEPHLTERTAFFLHEILTGTIAQDARDSLPRGEDEAVTLEALGALHTIDPQKCRVTLDRIGRDYQLILAAELGIAP